jgi:hypothetical protein
MRTRPARRCSPTRPELLAVGLVARTLRDDQVRVVVIALALAREQLAQLVERPVHHAIGGVVQHLPDDLPADPCVGAALDLDECRHRVLVEEQMVDRPAAARVLVVGKRSLAAHQEPAARGIPGVLVPSPARRVGNLAINACRTSSASYGLSRISTSSSSPRNRKIPPLTLQILRAEQRSWNILSSTGGPGRGDNTPTL